MGGSFVDCRTDKNGRPAADRSRRTGCSLLCQPGRGFESQALPRKQVPDLRVAQWPKPYVRNLRAEHDGHVPVRADAIVYRVGDDAAGCALVKLGLKAPGEPMSVEVGWDRGADRASNDADVSSIPLSFRTAGFPRYGWKAGFFSDGALPASTRA